MHDDPYWDLIQKDWEGIQKAYNMVARLRPILEYDIHAGQIASYDFAEYRETLGSPHSKMGLTLQYEEAEANNQIVLFIRDTEREKLRSYIIERDETIVMDPSRVTFVNLGAQKRMNKMRKKKKKRRRKSGKK